VVVVLVVLAEAELIMLMLLQIPVVVVVVLVRAEPLLPDLEVLESLFLDTLLVMHLLVTAVQLPQTVYILFVLLLVLEPLAY
jgi:hypothetical protein